ncbi:hypothetical protein SNEBB_001026 [Seison nebaliae]|nr:hypothetical protein SNEBB_001026 [Seison nebaliae]
MFAYFIILLTLSQYYSGDIAVENSLGTNLTCESFGDGWSELQVWDMHFLQFATDVIYARVNTSYINIGLDIFDTYGIWRDHYKSRLNNANNDCKLWLANEPDSEEFGVIWNKYSREGMYKIGDSDEVGHYACWKPFYHTRNVYFSLDCANSLHSNIKHLATSIEGVDPKIIMAPPNCYDASIITNSNYEAQIIYGQN